MQPTPPLPDNLAAWQQKGREGNTRVLLKQRELAIAGHEIRKYTLAGRPTLDLVASYTEFVKGFYTPEFAELLLHPSNSLGLRGAVTSLLAGHGQDRFGVNWRVGLFHMLVRLNRHFPLVPRLPGRRQASTSA